MRIRILQIIFPVFLLHEVLGDANRAATNCSGLTMRGYATESTLTEWECLSKCQCVDNYTIVRKINNCNNSDTYPYLGCYEEFRQDKLSAASKQVLEKFETSTGCQITIDNLEDICAEGYRDPDESHTDILDLSFSLFFILVHLLY